MHFARAGHVVEEMDRIPCAASKELRPSPACATSARTSAGPRSPTRSYGPNFTELWISIDPTWTTTRPWRRSRTSMDGYPGMYRDVQTYLQERIKEVLTGAERHHRRAALRPRPGRAAREGAGGQGGHGGGRGRERTEGRAAGLVPQIEVRVEPGRGGAVRPHTRPRPPRTDHACRRRRRWARCTGTEDLRRGRLGRTADPGRPPPSGRCPSTRPAGVGPARRRGRRDIGHAQRDRARRRLAADDITCNVQGRDLGAVAARDRGEGASSTSRRSITPSSWASTPPGRSDAAATALRWRHFAAG